MARALDGAPWFLFSTRAPVRNIFASRIVEETWREEFQGIYQCGGIVVLTMHPQFIGRSGRLHMLQRFLEYVSTFPNVWIATAVEVAEYRAQEFADHR